MKNEDKNAKTILCFDDNSQTQYSSQYSVYTKLKTVIEVDIIMSEPLFLRDPSNFRPSPSEFQCGERLEEGGGDVGIGGVVFFCTLPRSNEDNNSSDDDESENENEISNNQLIFSCRDRSCGVLEKQESAVTNEQFEATQNSTAVDPFFFDTG